MSAYTALTYAISNGVATISLNRPDARNAFDTQLRHELLEAVQAASADESVRVVVLTGVGKGFSAGADLRDQVPQLVQQPLEQEYKPALMAITSAPKPFISAVNGAAAGIGSAFAMACDLCVMAEDAYIYQAFAAIGLIPDGGATWHLVHQLGRKRAYELIVGGEKLAAHRCLELGLANRVVAADDLMREAQSWGEQLAEKSPLALRYSKAALNKAMQNDLADQISYEAYLQNICFVSEDFKEGVLAFLEKREAVFHGK